PVSKFYPPWLIEDEHPLTQAGLGTIEALWGEKRPLGTWDFSTNGTYWAGKAGIPSIGFGPGDEKFAHTSLEQVPLKEVVAATEFYALFPSVLSKQVNR
ncbi:MAG TPA: YgeY family selenium metabolism-linked hydrolase, partial [Anaerolineales bacterium]|nr:YgeY family selenium metabolism-linked hydrolase [Anaerolineales bacterium]